SSKTQAGWPDLLEMEPYFLDPLKQGEFGTGSDGATLTIEGVDGAEYLTDKHRLEIELEMWADRKNWGMLLYHKVDGRRQESYASIGDLRRFREYVQTQHGDDMPIALYIPFHKAWVAVKEFVVTDGELPKSIEWIAGEDLPPNTFPEP